MNGALFHVVFTMALPYWYAGCTVVIIDFVPDLCLDMIAKNRVTKTVPVATMLNLLVDIQARNPRDLSSLKHFGMGGAPVSIDTVTAAREAFGIDFVQYFGQTEATVQLTYLSRYDYQRGHRGVSTSKAENPHGSHPPRHQSGHERATEGAARCPTFHGVWPAQNHGV